MTRIAGKMRIICCDILKRPLETVDLSKIKGRFIKCSCKDFFVNNQGTKKPIAEFRNHFNETFVNQNFIEPFLNAQSIEVFIIFYGLNMFTKIQVTTNGLV